MKKLFLATTTILLALVLNGCLASTTSSQGINCNYAEGKPIYDMPLDCQGGR